MKKSIINLLLAHGQNIFLTALWSPLVIFPFLALFTNEIGDFFWNAFFAAWILQTFVCVFVHGIFLIPSYFWQNQEDKSTEELYIQSYPILLIPTAVYLALTSFIFFNEANTSHMILFAMFGFITIYSISLYTLLQKINKPISNEKVNQ